jgi:hypothetical protein
LQVRRFPAVVSAHVPLDANDPLGVALNETEPVGTVPAPTSATTASQLVA